MSRVGGKEKSQSPTGYQTHDFPVARSQPDHRLINNTEIDFLRVLSAFHCCKIT